MKGSQTHGKLQAAQREKRRKHPRSSEGNKASRVNLTGCSACGGPWRCKRFCRLWIFKMLACHSQVPLWMLAPYFSVLKEDCKGPIAQLPENGEKNDEPELKEGALFLASRNSTRTHGKAKDERAVRMATLFCFPAGE
ncbi:hypothetical protein LEMLEM_LOCUS4923 [Lemmus lemmus]